MRWGLFGGTFDPIHFGHLRAACELAGILSLDRVIFIPSASPPHKNGRVITPFAKRAQMTRLAIDGNPRFCVSDVENLREGKSYSIETVRYFLSKNPTDVTLYFITGQDAFDAITTWRDWESLLGLCHFVVMARPGYENKGLGNILPGDSASPYVYDEQQDGFQNPQGKYIFFRKTTFLDISSSDIRSQVQSGESIRYLTPDAVIRYIDHHHLYKFEE